MCVSVIIFVCYLLNKYVCDCVLEEVEFCLVIEFLLFFCHGVFCCHCCVVSVFFIFYFWLRISEWKWSAVLLLLFCYCCCCVVVVLAG